MTHSYKNTIHSLIVTVIVYHAPSIQVSVLIIQLITILCCLNILIQQKIITLLIIHAQVHDGNNGIVTSK